MAELASLAPALLPIPYAIHARHLEREGLVLQAASTLNTFARIAFRDVWAIPQRNPMPKTTGSVTASEAELLSLEDWAHLVRYMLLHSASFFSLKLMF